MLVTYQTNHVDQLLNRKNEMVSQHDILEVYILLPDCNLDIS